MRREHRPEYLVRGWARFQGWYARRMLVPHFDRVGEGLQVTNPWSVRVLGPSITLGANVHIRALYDQRVRFEVWPAVPGTGRIRVGDNAVINPGVCLHAACDIDIGRNAIIAENVYITDSDWHDLYDRVYSSGERAPVVLEENVWIGRGATVCNGVRVGRNSIIGAGAVVVRDVPACSVAAGNPATVIRELDPEREFVTRDRAFEDPDAFFAEAAEIQRILGAGNSLPGWLRAIVFPRVGD
jgi:acetyltransferase-like isoleucine patch superfamily enzyme